MQKVCAHCMAPSHVSPNYVIRIVLEKQMVLTLVIHEAVGVIDPILGRCEMELWPRKPSVLARGRTSNTAIPGIELQSKHVAR